MLNVNNTGTRKGSIMK